MVLWLIVQPPAYPKPEKSLSYVTNYWHEYTKLKSIFALFPLSPVSHWLKCCKHSSGQLQFALEHRKSWKSTQLSSKLSQAANSHTEKLKRKIRICVPVNTNTLKHKKWIRRIIAPYLCKITIFRTPAVTWIKQPAGTSGWPTEK